METAKKYVCTGCPRKKSTLWLRSASFTSTTLPKCRLFSGTPCRTLKKLSPYVSWKLRSLWDDGRRPGMMEDDLG